MLITAAALILLSGCGGRESSVTVQPCEISMEILTLYHNPDIEQVQEAVSNYAMEKIGCRVRLEEVLLNQHRAVLSRMNEENNIDIIVSGVTVIPEELKKQGLLMGIGELLEEYGQGILGK